MAPVHTSGINCSPSLPNVWLHGGTLCGRLFYDDSQWGEGWWQMLMRWSSKKKKRLSVMMSVSKGLNVLLFPRFIKWRDSTSGHLEVPSMFNDLQTWILHLIQPLFLLTAFSSFSSSAKAIVPFLCDMPRQRYQMSSKTLIDTTRSAPNLFFWKDLKLGAMNVNTIN